MTQDPRLVAYVAARQWADDHRHQTPDDRMLDIVYAAGYGQGRDDEAAGAGCDLDDPQAWTRANPALGVTVSEQAIRSALGESTSWARPAAARSALHQETTP